MEESTRRQLRFSMFLQGFAFLMFLAVVIVQFATGTASILTGLFAIACLGLGGALLWTRSLLRRP